MTRMNRLTLIGFSHYSKGKKYCKFACACGNTKVIRYNHVMSERIKSCGCLAKEKGNNYRHGYTGTRLYNVWTNMKGRCTNPNNVGYQNYGGRGISVCNDWSDSFISFMTWALANGYSDNLTIERKDVNSGYCPDNCTWISIEKQNENKTTTTYLTHNGETKSIKNWAEETGTSIKTICNRIYSGWCDYEAILGRNRE